MEERKLEEEGKKMGEKNNKKVETFIRVLGFVLSFVAAIVVGVDKQTKVLDPLGTFSLTLTAKWNYLSALV